MEGVDIGILIILFLPAIMGLLYGLLNVLFSIAAWIMAVVTATKLSGLISPLLADYLEPVLRNVIAFAGGLYYQSGDLHGVGIFHCKITWQDRVDRRRQVLGFFFGVGLGGAIITILIFVAGFTAISKNEWWHEAVLIEPFQRVCVWGQRFLSEDIAVYHRYEPAPSAE